MVRKRHRFDDHETCACDGDARAPDQLLLAGIWSSCGFCWPCPDQSAGNICGKDVQVGVGPRREDPADSLVQFILGDTVLDKRDLEHLNYLFAVSSGCPQAGLAFRTCCLVSGTDHHRQPPHKHDLLKA
jgi:hypothetical protein